MRRISFILVMLALALYPAVWARAMAEYPGWAGEVALRGARCDSISTRLVGWTALPDSMDTAGAVELAERLATKLGFAGDAVETSGLILITGTRAGVVASIQANLRDSLWLLTVDLTCSANGPTWYRLLNDTLTEAGYPGPIQVSVMGLKPGPLSPAAAALTAQAVCNAMLGGVINTVADGSGGQVMSGTAGLVPRQPGVAGRGGSFALSLNFSGDQQATLITVGVPGLR